MNEKAVNTRKEYYKKWRANNKDKVRATQARYWENRAKREEETRKNESEKE